MALGRSIASLQPGVNGQWVKQLAEYDSLGRVTRSTLLDNSTASTRHNVYVTTPTNAQSLTDALWIML